MPYCGLRRDQPCGRQYRRREGDLGVPSRIPNGINGMVTPSPSGINSAKVKSVMYRSRREEMIMKMTTIGIDLAKLVFQIHGVDTHGKVA